MENLIWSKTILASYRHLEDIAGAIDKIVLKSALGSFVYTSGTHFQNSVMFTAEKIIELSQRKITLINLKILTEKVLSSLKPMQGQILIQRYVENVKFKELAAKSSVNIRTIFRRLEKAEKAFADTLYGMGYTPERLAEMLKDEKWINAVYSSIEKCGQQEKGFDVVKVAFRQIQSNPHAEFYGV